MMEKGILCFIGQLETEQFVCLIKRLAGDLGIRNEFLPGAPVEQHAGPLSAAPEAEQLYTHAVGQVCRFSDQRDGAPGNIKER